MAKHTFQVTTSNFEQDVLKADLPVLVDFTADWCPPCKMIAPIVDELSQKYAGQMRVGTLDADTNQALINQYGVYGLPTLILFEKGQPVARIAGFKPREVIEKVLAPHLLEKA